MPEPFTKPAQILDALDRGPLDEDLPKIRAWVLGVKGHDDLVTTLEGLDASRADLVNELAEWRPSVAISVATAAQAEENEQGRLKLETDRVAGRALWRSPRTIQAVGAIIIAIASLLAGTQIPSATALPEAPAPIVGAP